MVVSAPDDALPRIERALRAGPDGDALRIRESNTEAFLQSLRRAADGVPQPQVFVEVQSERALLYVFYETPARLYFRELELSDGLGEANLETLVQLVASTLEAIEAGAELGWDPDRARDELAARGIETDEAPAIELGLGWGTTLHESSTLRHGPRLSAMYWSSNDWSWGLGLDLEGSTLEASLDSVQVRALGLGTHARFGVRYNANHWSFGFALNAGVLLWRSDPSSNDSTVTLNATALDAELVIGAAVNLRVTPVRWFALQLDVGAEAAPAPVTYVFVDDGVRRDVLDPLPVRPFATIRFVFRMFP